MLGTEIFSQKIPVLLTLVASILCQRLYPEQSTFRVEKIEGKGRGFIATTDIAAGTVLFMEKPQFLGISPSFRVDGRIPSKSYKKSLWLQNTKNKYWVQKVYDRGFQSSTKITDKLNLEPILEHSARSGGKFILIVVRMAASLLSERNFKTTGENKLTLLRRYASNIERNGLLSMK